MANATAGSRVPAPTNWRSPSAPDARSQAAPDTEKYQARRQRQGGRVVVLPPEGYGNLWSGGAR